MSNADKMFKELGYKKITKNFYNYLEYTKQENEELQLVISFNGQSKTFMCAMYQFGEKRSRGMATTMQELQAINEKVKELGWGKE
ncbi:MAG: hypothetical protein U0L22_04560 [Bacteroidales bacterium]|nr:hypothetical protein [Bacteroidales bacterium]